MQKSINKGPNKSDGFTTDNTKTMLVKDGIQGTSRMYDNAKCC